MAQRRQFLRATVAGSAAILAGCSGASESDNQDDAGGGGGSNANVVLEYSLTSGKSPDAVPSDISKSRENGGRREEGYKWIVVSFDVTQGTLDMEDVWFRSRVETSERFFDLDHGTADLTDGVQSRGEIKQGASGIALYQVPQDVNRLSWNLDEMRQNVDAQRR
ncbi:hypothetical protein ACFPYI_04375 [Halomarina salina]|uniref:DUF4352 domain-containing protein n=1 Tax=Halomarina salina TaxID=1872699 RepID=A0ABD5RJG8_9EURY|nr:hypothetical protein [Halomarina salina]